MNIKPTATGIFYPKTKYRLLKLLDEYNKKDAPTTSNLIIIPHAGYEFSGEIAFNAYKFFDKNTKNIVIIAPAIYNKIYGIVSSSAENFSTPIGDIKILPYDCEINNEILRTETAVGVQLPIIKYLFPDATVTPIIYGCEDFKKITEIIEKTIPNSSIAIVTNLSRFLPERESLRLDEHTARLISRKQTDGIDTELADGAIGICSAIEYAKNNNLILKEIVRTNSAKKNNDTSNVVGYGSWYFTNQ